MSVIPKVCAVSTARLDGAETELTTGMPAIAAFWMALWGKARYCR